jgi:hypothetical protein
VRRFVVAAVVLAPVLAEAHPLALGRIELAERTDGRVSVHLRVSGSEQQGSAVTLAPPGGCVADGPLALREVGDLWEARGRWSCARGLRGASLAVRGLEGSEVQLLLRVRLADGAVFEAGLDDHRRDVVVPLRRRSWEIVRVYGVMGARHIAEGADHLAFVLCLALWVRGARAVAAAVTGFTLGHSATLALAATGCVRLPQRPVEACIALSVALLAAEVAKGVVAPKGAWRVAGVFGLLHGLGFASALRDVGVAQGSVTSALLAFNLGVELGQLAFVAALLLGAWALRRAGVDVLRVGRGGAELAGVWSVWLLLQRTV